MDLIDISVLLFKSRKSVFKSLKKKNVNWVIRGKCLLLATFYKKN